MQLMILLFYTLAALLAFLSYNSIRGGIDYLKYFKKELSKPKSRYTPFATIVAPCKGFDEGLEENFGALLDQDYANYEVIFVVEDSEDPAAAVIEKISGNSITEAKRTKLVIAPTATQSSQKVENLREAVLHVSDESQVFVFVDSDARPARDWLRHLVAPLESENIGAATGYRWFISERPTFASEMRSVWNASIASALGSDIRTNFCWGGSMAIHRNTFEKLGIREKWDGTLSDDFVVTRTLNGANLPIYFVPQALTASVENCSVQGLFEFTTRQMKITRTYAPKLWLLSFFGAGLFNVVMVWAVILIFTSQNSLGFWVALLTLIVVSVASVGKAWIRLKAAKLVLQSQNAAIERQFMSHCTLWIFAPALFFCNAFAALVSRKMTWRGVEYELVSASETVVLGGSST